GHRRREPARQAGVRIPRGLRRAALPPRGRRRAARVALLHRPQGGKIAPSGAPTPIPALPHPGGGGKAPPSFGPGQLALDLSAVARPPLDHAIRPVLDAEEVKRRFGGVSPGSRSGRTDAQHRALLNVDTLAVDQELPAATDHDVDLVVVLVPVQERY